MGPVSGRGLRPCVFFDRDGIANIAPGAGYVEKASAFWVRHAFIEAVKVVKQKGWAAAIVSNQRGVAKGLTPREELEKMHAALQTRLGKEGISLDAIAWCGAADAADPRRKPNPGMILELCEAHGWDVARSWMVGDRERDVETGRNAGVAKTVRVDDDGLGHNPDRGKPTQADCLLPRLADLPALLRRALPDA
jgi:histidinol-phosphate phosphatase family protein